MSPCDERHTVEYPGIETYAPAATRQITLVDRLCADGISPVDGLMDRGTCGLRACAAEGCHQTRTLMDRVGRTEEGLRLLNKALELVDTTGERRVEAELYRLKGELLLKAGGSVRHAECTVETCFQKSIEVARSQQAKSRELQAAISLSRLWQHQGKRDKARQLLSEIYSWFTEGFDTPDLREAKALLETFKE